MVFASKEFTFQDVAHSIGLRASCRHLLVASKIPDLVYCWPTLRAKFEMERSSHHKADHRGTSLTVVGVESYADDSIGARTSIETHTLLATQAPDNFNG